MDFGWPVARPLLRMLGHRGVVDRVDHWFQIAEGYHVNEQSVRSLRRALRAAGFERPRVWIDPDVLRSGQYHLISALEGRGVRMARRLGTMRPFRLFLGNDLYGLAEKTES
jgi:hypothetical protein